jgi:hypothetical protein
VRVATATSKCSYQIGKQAYHECPAGTILNTFHIPLSEALRNHEAFVIMPSRTSSSAVQTQTKQKIFALFDKARQRFHVNLLSMATGCGHGNSISISVTEPYTGDQLNETLFYQIPSSNCNDVDLLDITMRASKIIAPVYWDHDQYLATSWARNCSFISNNWQPYGITNPIHAKGYNYESFVADGSNCTWFDDFSYTTIGPVQ